jgi:hypothetical protein
MKKVKSALEIALEKTKQFKKEGEGELEGLESEKYIKAALFLSRSFLQGKIDPPRVQEKLSRYPEKHRAAGVNAFLEEMWGNLNLKNTPQVLEMIALLSSDERITLACEEIKKISEQHQQQIKEKKAKLRETSAETLRQKYTTAGIGGSALAGFNIKHLEDWKDIAAQAEGRYQQALEGFRTACLSPKE